MKLRPAEPPVIWKPLPKQLLALQCPVDDLLFGGSVDVVLDGVFVPDLLVDQRHDLDSRVHKVEQ